MDDAQAEQLRSQLSRDRESHLEFLAEASAQLASSLDYEETLKTVRTTVRPTIIERGTPCRMGPLL
jgi:hypothetical protein